MPFIASVHASKWTEYLDHEYLELKKVSFQRFFSTQMIYTVPKKNKTKQTYNRALPDIWRSDRENKK